MKIASVVSMILVIVGALVWLLVGLFNFNLVAMLFGDASMMTRIIYSLVGISALWLIFYWASYRPFSTID